MLVPGSRPVGLRVGMSAVLGAWLDRFALGDAPSVPPGDAALLDGAVPGVVAVPPDGGGGPASGTFDGGGIFVVLPGSATLAGAPPGRVLSTGFIIRGAGVLSFMSGAFAPNGLRWSIGPCASTVPFQRGCSTARRSTTLTSAAGDRSTADASLTTTGCMNSMAHPPLRKSPVILNLAPIRLLATRLRRIQSGSCLAGSAAARSRRAASAVAWPA